MEVDISGLNELFKLFDSLEDDIIDGAKKGLATATYRLESDAKKQVTELRAVDTGLLKNSITSNINELESEVGTSTEYAKFVHDGTGLYNSQGRKTPWTYRDPKTGNFYTTSGMRPRPFLSNAYEEDKDKILDDIVDAIIKEVL